MTGQPNGGAGDGLDPLGVVDACDGKRNILSQRRPDSRKDLLQKPDNRVSIRTRFFMNRPNKKESVSFAKFSRCGCCLQRMTDNVHVLNAMFAEFDAVRM